MSLNILLFCYYHFYYHHYRRDERVKVIRQNILTFPLFSTIWHASKVKRNKNKVGENLRNGCWSDVMIRKDRGQMMLWSFFNHSSIKGWEQINHSSFHCKKKHLLFFTCLFKSTKRNYEILRLSSNGNYNYDGSHTRRIKNAVNNIRNK